MDRQSGGMTHPHGAGGRVRAPTVDEALPYSPLSSIVPFSPDIIPYPSAGPPTLSTAFSDRDERQASRKGLELLNQEASLEPTSVRLQRSLQDLQQLLQAKELTTFDFPRPKHFQPPSSSKSLHLSNGILHASQHNLSPFARMVLNNTTIPFRYPTPESPIPTSTKRPPQPTTAKQDLKRQNELQARNAAIFQQNARLSASSNGYAPPAGPQVSPGGTAVVIPALPQSSQHSDYQEFPDIDAKAQSGDGLSKKRPQTDSEVLSLSIDQRAKSDSAVQALQEQLIDIIEAEDQLEPDTSGALPSEVAHYFEFGQVPDSDAPILSPHMQSKLSTLVQNVISSKRFSEISVEDLTRIQKLCEHAVGTLESISLTIGSDWSESDAEEWVQRVETAESRLQSVRLLLRIMTAGRDEKELYSEDLVSQAINGLKYIVEMFVVRTVETRNSDSNKEAFATLSANRKPVGALFLVSARVLKLLGEFLTKVDVSESAITSVEFLAKELIFVENAHSEKDSAVGIQRFESLRLVAMDVIAKIFARYDDQRTFIFDEILTSLEKLPVTRQSARQFKLPDGKPIQLVSALLMRLVQTCATSSFRARHLTSSTSLEGPENGAEYENEEATSPARGIAVRSLDEAHNIDLDQALQELKEAVQPLYDSATKSARYVVNFLVQRALTSTKTGDQPYRNLLDIFTEDFLNVLGRPDWPAAEALLYMLLLHMNSLLQGDKTPVPAKNMALDLMGLIGSGISDLQIYARNALRTVDISESNISAKLVQLAEDLLEEKQTDMDFVEFDGPWRMALEYLQHSDVDDAQLQSAKGFHLTQWAKSTMQLFESKEGLDDNEPPLEKDLILQLHNAVADPNWLDREYEFESVSASQGRLAAAVTTLNLPFCKALGHIFTTLLTNMTSDHATLKSRSLKSVTQLLEKDASILDRTNMVLNQVLKCTEDRSSLVRDSALDILGKCLSLRPSLEQRVWKRIITRINDTATPVRKRVMKLLKDIYLHNDEIDIKSQIADAVLKHIQDQEQSVADLARQIIEDIWFAPFYGVSFGDDAPLQSRLALQKQVSLIAQTLQRGEGVLAVLDGLLQRALSNDSKQTVANFKVCKAMIALMFDMIVDNDGGPNNAPQVQLLQTLTVFAKASPKLFTAQQLELLKPYIKNIKTTVDLNVFRHVVTIFRLVFPSLSSLQHNFLKEVQDALFGAITKASKAELDELASCLWIMDGVLKNTFRLANVVISVLKQINAVKDADTGHDQQQIARLRRLITIVGYFGRTCNFENDLARFQEHFPWFKGKSVAALMVDIVLPFTHQKQPSVLRETALESVGLICQAFPKQFLRKDVYSALRFPFMNEDRRLEQIILSGFREFFAQEEKRSESGAAIKVGEGEVHGSERLGGSLIGTDNDGASTGLAQQFLPHILKIALSKPDELALTATHVIASINKQGLVHPKECGAALVALETSSNAMIANIAFQEHRNLHQKHETMFEKEYMKAVYQAFQYQRDVLQSPGGITTQPYASKLQSTFEVLKMGSSKVRKRFLSNISAKCNFELPKLAVAQGDMSEHVLFTRFCMENLAFFDYVRLDELLPLILALEKIVTGTGTTVAHAIETDVLKMKLEESSQAQKLDQPPDTIMVGNVQAHIMQSQGADDIDPARLRQLATASTILMIIWETRTFLRRLWGLQKQTQPSAAAANGAFSKPKAPAKDPNKAPSKVPFVTGDKFVDRVANLVDKLASDTSDADVSTCRALAELLAVDNELRVASEDDEDEIMKAAGGYETPSEDEDGQAGVSAGGRGKKRKGSVGAGSTPKRPKIKKTPSKKGSGRPRKRSGSKSSADDDDESGWD
ncbi:sister chromatid cohesion protein Mis4 [Rhizodiscina lignyota]|uniref:Sister chromatid cohesion protein n=1 Tax=Rhizodiscina lignyota TaxID=1504668 RepID=A0A9P4MD71_9PEZI|nr:sister chromatid cohesion protein Mis4 [Rhizodiscina lignyota]